MWGWKWAWYLQWSISTEKKGLPRNARITPEDRVVVMVQKEAVWRAGEPRRPSTCSIVMAVSAVCRFTLADLIGVTRDITFFKSSKFCFKTNKNQILVWKNTRVHPLVPRLRVFKEHYYPFWGLSKPHKHVLDLRVDFPGSPLLTWFLLSLPEATRRLVFWYFSTFLFPSGEKKGNVSGRLSTSEAALQAASTLPLVCLDPPRAPTFGSLCLDTWEANQ